MRFFCKKDNTCISLIFCFLQFESPIVIHEVKVKPAFHCHLRRDQKVLVPCSLKSAYPSKIFELSLQK